MKYCIHCGKELLDEATVCPYCGTVAGTETNAKAAKNPNKKVLVIVGVIVVLLAAALAVGALMLRLKPRELTEEETYALRVAQQLKESLLVPDSIHIYDMYINLYDEDIQVEPILSETIGGAYIHYSATNRGGGITEAERVAFIGEDGNDDEIFFADKDWFLDGFKQVNQGGTLSDGLIEALANNMYEDSLERFKDKGIEVDAEWVNDELNS